MRVLLSILLVFGMVGGLAAAFRGPQWHHGSPYGYAYGPCAPGWYGAPGWNGAPWRSGEPWPTPPAGTPSAPVTPAAPAGPTQ
jgi:hypothetical protein